MTAKVAATRVPALKDPIARIAVDVSLPHLDRPFDYLVAVPLAERVVPGSRVRVRFAGQLVDGFVLERLAESEHAGRLAFVERSVSAEVVLTPEISRLARAVADHWAGTLADVLRLAVPPRHAQAEAPTTKPDAAQLASPDDAGGSWAKYTSGGPLLNALRAGRSPRAIWVASPGRPWATELAELVATTLASGRGVVVVVPDGRDAGVVDAELAARLGAGQHVTLTADLGPAERYRRFLAVSRGAVRAVVGTRAAAFAPVRGLGLVVVWDDGDDLHAEPRAPYPHARDVLVMRAHLAGAAVVIGGHAVTAESARWVGSGWAKLVAPTRTQLRSDAPSVHTADEAASRRAPSTGGRLPTIAWETVRAALAQDRPALIQVPRRGYLPGLACDSCRAPLRCATCAGPLSISDAAGVPSCRWCGRIATGWTCSECGGHRFRATVVGARRTADELGRAFPGVVVRTSAQGQVLARVPAGASLVIATPGAEPIADGGYGVAVLLDGWALLGRLDLRASEEALRRWLNAAALVRSASDGGRVVVLADSSLRVTQALVRWDPVGHAERELAERVELGLPPARLLAELTGAPAAVAEFVDSVTVHGAVHGAVLGEVHGEVLGPVPVAVTASRFGGAAEANVRALIKVDRANGAALAAALHDVQAVRSARKAAVVRVRLDPLDIG